MYSLATFIFCLCVCAEMIKEVLALDDQIKSIADELYEQKSLLVMGRGYNYATCLEGALVSTFDLQNEFNFNPRDIQKPFFFF